MFRLCVCCYRRLLVGSLVRFAVWISCLLVLLSMVYCWFVVVMWVCVWLVCLLIVG